MSDLNIATDLENLALIQFLEVIQILNLVIVHMWFLPIFYI